MRGQLAFSAGTLAALVAITGCTETPTRMPAPLSGFVVQAPDVVRLAMRGDFTADAVLEGTEAKPGSDGMELSLFWRVVRCHTEQCRVGSRVETRHGAPFPVSGDFCRASDGRASGDCIRRDSLASYVGETFLAGFYRGAYIQQSTGDPMPDASSVNGGHYLISNGQLYINDPHVTMDASYREVEELLRLASAGAQSEMRMLFEQE